MDEADMSDQRIESTLAIQIELAKSSGPHLVPIGQCYYCQSGVHGRQLFCDNECAADWQHDHDRKKALGR